VRLSAFVNYILNVVRPVKSKILRWTGRVDEISAYYFILFCNVCVCARACVRACVCMGGFCNVCVYGGFVMCGCFGKEAVGETKT